MIERRTSTTTQRPRSHRRRNGRVPESRVRRRLPSLKSSPAAVAFKGCPRCGGDLLREEYLDYVDLVCIQCGNHLTGRGRKSRKYWRKEFRDGEQDLFTLRLRDHR
jgi:predicted RNA-binding Zn-ribbon protein involved in translation (DUF1610 family)